jgi:23S rRNA pseudouridine1911/1915/1917 synthase
MNELDEERQIEITLDAPGERLDKALADVHPDLSRVQWQKLIKEQQVSVNGRWAKASMRLEGGEVVTAVLPAIVETDLIPEDIPLDSRYEDDDLLVINKPAGMVVHPGTGHDSRTLVHAVLHYCPDVLGVGYEKRPGIVHRLDKYTSGLIIVAKNDRALWHVQKQFRERTVEKVYLALVEGHLEPAAALIDAAIGRAPNHRKRMEVIPPNSSATAKSAQTHYAALVTYDDYTLVECRPKTGRTHQIRVHMAYIGFPIVGDNVYGTRRTRRTPLGRHFLHAAQLTFRRPSDDEPITTKAELPSDLQAFVDQLEI